MLPTIRKGKAMDVVYATGTTHVTLASGQRLVVHKGSHWPVSDPVVKAQPSLFSADPRWGMAYSVEPDGYNDPVVEQASAAPGEKRNARRTS